MRTIHQLTQGSDAWCQFRLEHDGASEAAPMLGLSKKVTRSELLRMKHTGLAREFSDWVQANILDHGHAVEAMARPHFERLLDEDLYPVTLSDGRISASCDGLTMSETQAWEHKQWNEALAASVAAGVLPEEHMPQAQQVLMVTGADELCFGVSDGTAEKMVHMFVRPDPAWFARIRAGWQQFHADLAAYALPEDVAPTPAGKAPETLPALRIEINGAVTASNLAEFKDTALTAIRSVNRDLKTDADFADAESAVKWCSEVESRLTAAKEHALSQTASIDQLFKTIDDISAEARRVRLDLDKLVKARKESIRGEIIAGAMAGLRAHIEHANILIAPHSCAVPADFGAAIKGKRTIDSMRNAVDTELARAKIDATGLAERIRASMNMLAFHDEHRFLFNDASVLVLKAPDDLAAIISNRIAAHKAQEAARIAAETARIRAEEQAKAQREADAKIAEAARVERERVAADEAAQRQKIAAEEAAATLVREAAEQALKQAAIPAPPAAPAPGPITFAEPPAPVANRFATLNLGDINARFGAGFSMTANFVENVLGVKPAGTDRRAALFLDIQFGEICDALARHIVAVCETVAA